MLQLVLHGHTQVLQVELVQEALFVHCEQLPGCSLENIISLFLELVIEVVVIIVLDE